MDFWRLVFVPAFFGAMGIAVAAPIASWIVLWRRRRGMPRTTRSPHPLGWIIAALLAWCALAVVAVWLSIWSGFFYAWCSVPAHWGGPGPPPEHPPVIYLLAGFGIEVLMCGAAYGLHRF